MGFFGFVFWMVVLWIAYRWWRRSGRAMAGPSGYAPTSGWYDSGQFYSRRQHKIARKQRDAGPDQQAYIESLESRVTELEERLDFTERLLAERREPVSQD